MQLEEINSFVDIFLTRFKRRKGIVSRVFKTIYDQFSIKVLWIQFTFFTFLCVGIQERYNWDYIYHIDNLMNYIKTAINYYLGLLALLLFIRLIIWAYQYFYDMIKHNWDVSWFLLKEKPYYILSVSWLVQIAISRIIVKWSFNMIDSININIIKYVSQSSYIAFFLLLITLWQWYLNILLGFFSIKTKPYRTNYLLWPSILILIFIIYLNYLA